MTDPTDPADPVVLVKNPARVPWVSQVDDPVGTAGTVAETAQEITRMSDFKFNPQTGNYEATADGIYEREAKEPSERIRTQLRKGHAVTEADAKAMKRVGAWPGETTPQEGEEQATAKAKPAPENKSA